MNKQEKAEWLAGKVLDYKWYSAIQVNSKWTKPYWEGPVGEATIWLETGRELEEFIYSPDGFFAVWDAVINEPLRFEPGKDGAFGCFLGHIDTYEKDRYEAFYNAVYEAMKGE
jgi:hypothetical protein